MSPDTTQASQRVLQRIGALLVVVLVTLAGLSTGRSADADTGFSGSTPSEGAVVADPVTLVTLIFTASAEPTGEGFVALDASGQVRTPTAVSTLDGKVFNLRFDPPLAGGEIGVRWSVTGADAHPLSGSFSFTVTAPAPVVAIPATVPTTPASTTADAGIGAADDGDMSQMSTEEMASMDDFLTVDAKRPGELRATLGRLISFAGIALAIGAIAFAATTLRGETREIRSLVSVVRIVGGVIAVGAAIEYSGVARIAGESLAGYWRSSPGFATMLRLLAGVAIAAGLTATTVSVRSARRLEPLSSAPNTIAEGRRRIETEPARRWVADRSSALAFVGVGAAVISFWFDGHTVSKGFRPLHAVANSVHVVAGSVWMGGIVALAVLLWTRHRRGVPSRALGLVVRFSSVATVALGAVVLAGLVMAVSVLDSFGGLTGTQWGQMLLLKTAAVGCAMAGGAYNHFRLLPALDAHPDDPVLHAQVRSIVTAEAIMLSFVVVVTAWLVAAAS